KLKDAFEIEIADWKTRFDIESKQLFSLRKEAQALCSNLEELKQRNNQLSQDLSLSSLKISEQEDTIQKLRKKGELDKIKITELVRKMEGTLIQQSQKRGSIFSSNVDYEKKALKQKQKDLKAMEQRLFQECEKKRKIEMELQEIKSQKLILEKELIEIKKKGPQVLISRNLSTSSGNSLMKKFSSVNSLSRKRLDDASKLIYLVNNGLEFDASLISLEGYLKIPKPRGIRYGWHKVYVHIKDYTLYLSPSKEDLEHQKPILNLRHDAFSVKQDSMATEASGNVKELLKKLKNLQKDIETEERIMKGAEALVKIGTGVQKSEAEKQYEASMKRLTNMKIEAEKIKTLDAYKNFNDADQEVP
ncbi:hypothetical protein ROZALSC1DRAFT_21927, partial [Rozella allomycis CSF55]